MTSKRLLLAVSASLMLFVNVRAQQPDPLPRLTPRPSLTAGVAEPLISLNGIWLFRPDIGTQPDSVALHSDGWSPIEVPSEWVMQSFSVKPGNYAAYRRTFDIPADWAGKRVILRFDGVHSVCHVLVNGAMVGEHEGCFTVFEFDITGQARAGSNVLFVEVKSESIADTLASASQYAAHQLGGITRKVTLFAVPEEHVSSLVTTTSFDRPHKQGNVVAGIDVSNDSPGATAPLVIDVELKDPHGKKALATPLSVEVPSLAAGESRHQTISIKIPNVMKWDPEHPNLYSLSVSLEQNGETRETVTQRVGVRQVEVHGNRVFVNGAPIKLHGVNRHEIYPTLGRSLTPEFWRKDAELFREANVNYIRTSHYPPAEEFLDACDELGLFVECEAPLCWVQHPANETWKEWDYRDQKFLPYLLRANLENVAANRHHPSIIIWSLANESYWSPSFARVLDAVHRADPSRLTSFHDQCWGTYNNGGSKAQVAVYHYPDESTPEQCNKESRPVLFGEYTHVECYNRKEGVTDPGIRDQWGGPFRRMYDLVYRNPGCLGGAIWAGIDEIFYLPDGRVTGYGPWGIIDAWRRPKPEYWHVKKSYSPVRLIDPASPHPIKNGVIQVPLENRFNFTDLSEVRIDWAIGPEKGRAFANIAPRQKGILSIHPVHQPGAGETLALTFTDPRGFVCETEDLVLAPTPPAVVQPDHPSASLDSTESRYVVRGKDFVCEIDRSSGRIVHAEARGTSVLVGGPELMILPLQSGECVPDYRLNFPVLNNSCRAWRQKSIQAHVAPGGSVQVTSTGEYAEAGGSATLSIYGDGTIDVEYNFRIFQETNPRQWGMVLYAPGDLDSLSWERHALWSVYPAHHIGRPAGSGVAHPHARDTVGTVPAGDWSSDANELGTNDFRSTKSDVVWGSLLSGKGYGIHCSAGPSHAIRAFVDGQRTGLLVAGFDSGGGDPFFAPHHAGERRPLKEGDVIKDTFTLHLVHQ